MGQKFTITESERNQIRGLYEQSTPPQSGTTQPKVYNITKVDLNGFQMPVDGTITANNDNVLIDVTIKGKTSKMTFKIINKSEYENGDNYQCSWEGPNGGYDKVQVAISHYAGSDVKMPKLAILTMINSFTGQQQKLTYYLR